MTKLRLFKNREFSKFLTLFPNPQICGSIFLLCFQVNSEMTWKGGRKKIVKVISRIFFVFSSKKSPDRKSKQSPGFFLLFLRGLFLWPLKARIEVGIEGMMSWNDYVIVGVKCLYQVKWFIYQAKKIVEKFMKYIFMSSYIQFHRYRHHTIGMFGPFHAFVSLLLWAG